MGRLRDILYAVVSGDEVLSTAGWAQLRRWYGHYRTGVYTTPPHLWRKK